ncbi:MAG: response regulator transcription factor [Patescibacteria group bacterium]|jgi:two-component system alkaline phosphatase synthesis response regulator PhoP
MKILVADDDPKLNKLVCAALREVGYSPDAAFTIADARTKIALTNFDLALIDWMFDGETESGLDLVKEIVEMKNFPILMLSGRSALADRVSGLRAGADDYLIKPFYLPELLARVAALLRRPRKIASQKFVVGSLTLDPNSFEISLDGLKIPLRKKEFQLLLALVEAGNETVNRALLGRLVWGDEGVVVSNAIDVHIKSLRERLGKFGQAIETVRGVGYRFDPNFKSGT